MLQTDYDACAALARDPARYAEEKLHIANTVQGLLKERFGGLLEEVEEVDVATPLTWERHSANWRGAYEGWLPTRSMMARNVVGGLRKTLPGLADFYMVGQWVVPGGELPRRGAGGAGPHPAALQAGPHAICDERADRADSGGGPVPGSRSQISFWRPGTRWLVT